MKTATSRKRLLDYANEHMEDAWYDGHLFLPQLWHNMAAKVPVITLTDGRKLVPLDLGYFICRTPRGKKPIYHIVTFPEVEMEAVKASEIPLADD